MTEAVKAVKAEEAVEARPIGRRFAFVLLGALGVAAAAQVSIPIPGSPVPFTLQPMAVLIVGGLLGAQDGALSLAIYLAMGAAGLPVFAPFGAPGLARLLGPTGGFLIAYPFAAFVTGTLARPRVRASARPRARAFLAALAGMVVIFAGGIAQLAMLGASVSAIITPFLAADVLKAGIAGLVISRFPPTRSPS